MPFCKKQKCDMWHMTCDMWHMTYDTWHETHETWHVTGCGEWTFSQNFSSLAITICDLLWRFGGKGWLTESVNYKGVCRTAPAIAGLFNIIDLSKHKTLTYLRM